MKKKYRVLKTAEFQEIMNRRKYKNMPAFTIYIQEKREDHARFGIAVPKKLGNAVYRNKAKRQVRNMLEELSPFGLMFDGIILVRKQFDSNSYNTNKEDLEKLLKTVKI